MSKYYKHQDITDKIIGAAKDFPKPIESRQVDFVCVNSSYIQTEEWQTQEWDQEMKTPSVSSVSSVSSVILTEECQNSTHPDIVCRNPFNHHATIPIIHT